MRGGINPVRSQSYFKKGVVTQIKKHSSRSTRNSILIQYHNPFMRGTDSKLIFGTDHPHTLNSSYLRSLYLNLFSIGKCKACTNSCHKNLLSGSHIGCSAYNLQRFVSAHINFSHAKLICIRMFYTFKDLTHHDTGQPSGNLLCQTHPFNFKTYSV
ncbi:hypothetical protein SDC9_150257 [bioreactor metagenome]|uniref:Uncharacterized protein n=1 Tax=bioreactor metagenome TaxID=1076179 RepID=A0A645ER07_9ZZZZ